MHEALATLERTLRSRAAERPEGSYTVKLLDDPKLIGEKVEEEAEEVVRAAREESDERVAEEAADLLYHLAVLLASREVPAVRGDGGAQWPSPLTPSCGSSRASSRPASWPSEGNVVPVCARFVDDCETPVSAFLKLRAGEPEGAPCFLLESAEQGQVGRYSFVGFRPRSVLRWSDGVLSEDGGSERQAPDPYAAVAEHLAALPAGAGRGPAAVQRRRRRLLRLRPGAHGRAARPSPTPTRSACPTWR